jgi:hypothetical protein
MHGVPGGVHGVTPLRVALSEDETRNSQESAFGHPWRIKPLTVRGDRKYLPDGNLSVNLFGGMDLLGEASGSLSSLLAHLFHRRRKTQSLLGGKGLLTDNCLWAGHLGYSPSKSAEGFAASYGEFKQAALAVDSSYCVKGILTDGFDSTRKSLRRLFPFAKLANCFLHATLKFPAQIQWVSKTVRQTLTHQFCQLFFAQKACKTSNNRSLGQRLRRFVEQVRRLAGEENGQRVRRWIERKKAGWYALREDSSIPKTSTPLDQIHNAIDRKLFMMKGFHHEVGSQRVFLNGIAILQNLIPYQRRAINGGKCAIEVEGGKVPTRDWFVNLQILTSGGFQ